MGAKRLKRAAAQPASVAMVASAEPQPRGLASTEVKQDGHRIRPRRRRGRAARAVAQNVHHTARFAAVDPGWVRRSSVIGGEIAAADEPRRHPSMTWARRSAMAASSGSPIRLRPAARRCATISSSPVMPKCLPSSSSLAMTCSDEAHICRPSPLDLAAPRVGARRPRSAKSHHSRRRCPRVEPAI
jgi:hypothetical protein